MSLHDEIKLPELPAAIDHRLNDFAIACVFPDREARIDTARQLKKSIEAYARHAAAELAIASDARIEALEAALEAAQKDAARYRFLRRGSLPFHQMQMILNDSPFGIDESVDKALKGQP